jgi:uncharacterized protein YecA (UPF0149 family)
MDTVTGEIYEFDNIDQLVAKQAELGRMLVPLTEKQAVALKPLSKRKRKFLMRKGECICGSGKSFKKCCSKRYK